MQNSLSKISGGAGTLSCFLLVLLGCLGFNLDVSHYQSLLERTILYRYAEIMAVCPRTEETTNKIEFSGAYSLAVLDKIAKILPPVEHILVAKLRNEHVQDAKIDVSISRLGEVIFRMSFAPYVTFGPQTHAWTTLVCKLYTAFFTEILDGSGW